MKSRRQIPLAREADVLHMYWMLLGSLESRTNPVKEALDRGLVEAGYRQLRELGYTTHHAQWHDKLGEVPILNPS